MVHNFARVKMVRQISRERPACTDPSRERQISWERFRWQAETNCEQYGNGQRSQAECERFNLTNGGHKYVARVLYNFRSRRGHEKFIWRSQAGCMRSTGRSQANVKHDGNDPSARSPNGFFIEMRLGMKWLVTTNDMKDAGDQNPLDAQSLRPISICLPKCFT
jgi:hypothetical protein